MNNEVMQRLADIARQKAELSEEEDKIRQEVLVPAFFIAIRLGWLERAIKKTNFAYTSPFLLGIAKRSMGLCFFILITTFVIPMALYPEVVPVLFGTVVLLLGFSVGNIQKRI